MRYSTFVINMENIILTLNKIHLDIDKKVFMDLLDISHIKEYKKYTDAIDSNKISFKNLKELAVRAAVPYPLFFAPQEIVDLQIANKNKELDEKMPSKDEIRITSRGRVELKDIELLIKDFGRKQEFLKNRVLIKYESNRFIGSLSSKIKNQVSHEDIATEIRNYLGIDLNQIRNLSKDKVLKYITNCAEKRGMLISFSSYNYMPQNIQPELELSGICIKDKKFPFIFINTRDGDKKPKIIESTGRQVFTLLSMISCVGMGVFLLSSKEKVSKNDPAKVAYSIAGEILVPKKDLIGIQITTLEGLKEKAHFFRVTPSMLLFQLEQHKKIHRNISTVFRVQLNQEVKKALPPHIHAPLPSTGYGKYNGERFSKEVINAYNTGIISQMEVKNILFRQGKMDPKLLEEYCKKYK